MDIPKDINSLEFYHLFLNKCEEARREGKEPIVIFKKVKKPPNNVESLVQCDCKCWVQQKTINTKKHIKSKRHLSGIFSKIASHYN